MCPNGKIRGSFKARFNSFTKEAPNLEKTKFPVKILTEEKRLLF
jgi:hypothetical protein